MSALRLSSLSTQWVKVGPIRIVENGDLIDPTAGDVEFALKEFDSAGRPEEPEGGDWVAGSWETGRGRYWARVLVGPAGDIDPGDGTWAVWVKIARSPETIVASPGRIHVT